ncbi:MAG: S-layer homology domain-containing protein, partial [Clostridia bacterium]|nr:S-layer homology domain-containing protein [Clostridia bacterium]
MKRFTVLIALLLCAVMLIGAIPFTANAAGLPFEDVPEGKWFYKAVEWAYNKGAIAGKSATSFAPNDPITRAEF